MWRLDIDWFGQDGAPDTGGTLKIYGEALRKEVNLKDYIDHRNQHENVNQNEFHSSVYYYHQLLSTILIIFDCDGSLPSPKTATTTTTNTHPIPILGALQDPPVVSSRHGRRSCPRDGWEVRAAQVRGPPLLPGPEQPLHARGRGPGGGRRGRDHQGIHSWRRWLPSQHPHEPSGWISSS